MKRAYLIPFLAVSVGAAVSGSAYALTQSSHTPGPGTSAPGLAAPVSALKRIPPSQNPADVTAAAEQSANSTGGSPATALASLRLLRTDTGFPGVSVYGFDRGDGRVCLLVQDWAGACPMIDNGTPGFEFIIAGGHSKTVGSQTIVLPSAVVGIAADNIQSLSILVGGSTTSIQIENNAFFYPLVLPAQGEPWNAQLQVSYSNGATQMIQLPDPRS